MPRPRIHASAAARQAAFRVRREQARQAVLAAKGLPALPAIPSMQGAPGVAGDPQYAWLAALERLVCECAGVDRRDSKPDAGLL
jgi:hypothetical protein